MLDFTPQQPPEKVTVFNTDEIPKEMDIFLRSEASFLPEGKTFDDLTYEEQKELQNKYRFSPFRPGFYQGITGLGGSI